MTWRIDSQRPERRGTGGRPSFGASSAVQEIELTSYPQSNMTMTTKDDVDWLIPASIPFEELKAKDLEECVYWLLDAMGAQDIEWRVGGTGGGASDGGRDLEAKILVPSEDGDLTPKTFWFECKGRKGTVEREAVKDAAVNALAYSHVDTIVIATNTTFSNPTVDWVKAWNRTHPRPQVQLWDKSKLEQLISRQPSVVLRLFSDSLSLSGRLQALSSRFWSRLEYAPIRLLEDLWANRDSLDLGPLERFALIANECANRTLERRPWGAAATPEAAVDTLQLALLNVYYLFLRMHRAGANQAPIFKSLTYVLLNALRHTSAAGIAWFLKTFIAERESGPVPDSVLNLVIEPILGHLAEELAELCVPDCRRVSRLRRKELTADGDDLATYWYRFSAQGIPVEEDDDRILWLEHQASPCEVGFTVNDVQGCPLISPDLSLNNLEDLLKTAQRVTAFRIDRDREKKERKQQDKQV
ncbi:restriction endonuclease [Pseudomonas sp. GCM10022186]|uniref:restriction endonuclease n=1 Tax=Pseudomonas sp. GCM10022186 TaxID=3252650 RepID=UPI00360F1B80